MSGYKRATVTISEPEYRRLHEADMKKRLREHKKTKTRNADQTANLVHTLQQMESRQRQLEQAFTDLDQNSNWMDEEIVQGILAQNAVCYEGLAAIIEETTLDANTSLALLYEHFEQEMRREREQHQQNLQSLFQRLNTYEQREQGKSTRARQWLRQSVIVADFIREQFDHERFFPGRFSKILRSLNLAQMNLADGLPEASLQISQQAFVDLSELQFELEQRIVEWQAEYEQASRALLDFIAELELNATVNAFGLEGEELPDQVDVAYWSNGKYDQLLNKCRSLSALLSQEQQRISIEELTRTHADLLPAITEKLESIIYDARLNALNSQLRMNIAETALQALENHGFKLNEAGYVNKDMRAPFMVQLNNSDGSQVTIQVLPTNETAQELTNELVVVTKHPYLKTEQEARLQWAELCRSLNEFNLNVSRPEVRSAPALSAPDGIKQPRFLRHPIRSEKQSNVR